MSDDKPRVSLGLPVCNGEKYLEEALDALLVQTYPDFELIISDNASTDRTPEICRAYTAKDRRIRYFRNETNLGAAKNYNRVFALSSGEYFKWASHDDVCAPDFLRKCVTVLDHDPSIILCYTRIMDIDEQGKYLGMAGSVVGADSVQPDARFRSLIRMQYSCTAICGVIRARILKRTPLIQGYADSDRVLLSELGLYGRFYEVPETLFFRRVHPGSSVRRYPGRVARTEWFDPTAVGRVVFPHWRQFLEYLLTLRRVPVAWPKRILCYLAMCKWLTENRRRMLNDILDRIWVCIPRGTKQWVKRCLYIGKF